MPVCAEELHWLTCQDAVPGLPIKLLFHEYSPLISITPPPSLSLAPLFLTRMKLHLHKSPRKKNKKHNKKTKKRKQQWGLSSVFFFFSAQNASNNKSNHVRWLFWQLPIDDFMHATRRMSFSYIPTDVSAMSALSVWLVMYCICLLTSLFIYRCLACNHGWHETPWCKLWRVNIPISLPAFAATETWIRARHVTHTSYWWERQQTGCS